MSASDAESLQAEKRWRREQVRAKLPFLIVSLAFLGCLALFSLFAADANFSASTPRGDWLFLSVYGAIVALVVFFIGPGDWTHLWSQLKRRLGIGQEKSGSKSLDVERTDSKDGLPATFGGWIGAVLVACCVIWYLVSLVWQACESIFK